jgi:predicted Rossmann-fold nucleotide-binding protein
VRFASRTSCCRAAIGTLGELSECLTLVADRAKTRRIPIILVGSRFLEGLPRLLRDDRLVAEAMMVDERDLDLCA